MVVSIMIFVLVMEQSTDKSVASNKTINFSFDIVIGIIPLFCIPELQNNFPEHRRELKPTLVSFTFSSDQKVQ